MGTSPVRFSVDPEASRCGAVGATIAAGALALSYRSIDYDDGANRSFVLAALSVGVLVGLSLPTLRRAVPTPGVSAGTFVVVLVATYLCVPETDQFHVALWLPLGVAGAEIILRRQLGIEWYGAAAVPIAWAGMLGTNGRFSAMAGMLFAWWAVVHVPLVTLFRPLAASSGAAKIVAAVGALAAVIGVRTGGVADERGVSALMLVSVGVVSLAASVVIAGMWLRRRASAPGGLLTGLQRRRPG